MAKKKSAPVVPIPQRKPGLFTCERCQRGVLWAWNDDGILVPLEVELMTPEGEAALWGCGWVTYAQVGHAEDGTSMYRFREPATDLPLASTIVRCGHICHDEARQIASAIACVPWFGHDSEYIVVADPPNYHVCKKNGYTGTYAVHATRRDEALAHDMCYRYNWRERKVL